jgi:cell division protein FtsB
MSRLFHLVPPLAHDAGVTKQTASRSTRAKRARSMRPVVATVVLSLGLVCAAAFTGITVQANALERAKGVLSDEIAAEQARNAQLEASIAQKKTTDYLIQKAQDYDFIKQGEGLIAVERSTPTASAPRADGGRASRVARWIQLFFGTR